MQQPPPRPHATDARGVAIPSNRVAELRAQALHTARSKYRGRSPPTTAGAAEISTEVSAGATQVVAEVSAVSIGAMAAPEPPTPTDAEMGYNLLSPRSVTTPPHTVQAAHSSALPVSSTAGQSAAGAAEGSRVAVRTTKAPPPAAIPPPLIKPSMTLPSISAPAHTEEHPVERAAPLPAPRHSPIQPAQTVQQRPVVAAAPEVDLPAPPTPTAGPPDAPLALAPLPSPAPVTAKELTAPAAQDVPFNDAELQLGTETKDGPEPSVSGPAPSSSQMQQPGLPVRAKTTAVVESVVRFMRDNFHSQGDQCKGYTRKELMDAAELGNRMTGDRWNVLASRPDVRVDQKTKNARCTYHYVPTGTAGAAGSAAEADETVLVDSSKYSEGDYVFMKFDEGDGTAKEWIGKVDKVDPVTGLMTVVFDDGEVHHHINPNDKDVRPRYPSRPEQDEQSQGQPANHSERSRANTSVPNLGTAVSSSSSDGNVAQRTAKQSREPGILDKIAKQIVEFLRTRAYAAAATSTEDSSRLVFQRQDISNHFKAAEGVILARQHFHRLEKLYLGRTIARSGAGKGRSPFLYRYCGQSPEKQAAPAAGTVSTAADRHSLAIGVGLSHHPQLKQSEPADDSSAPGDQQEQQSRLPAGAAPPPSAVAAAAVASASAVDAAAAAWSPAASQDAAPAAASGAAAASPATSRSQTAVEQLCIDHLRAYPGTRYSRLQLTEAVGIQKITPDDWRSIGNAEGMTLVGEGVRGDPVTIAYSNGEQLADEPELGDDGASEETLNSSETFGIELDMMKSKDNDQDAENTVIRFQPAEQLQHQALEYSEARAVSGASLEEGGNQRAHDTSTATDSSAGSSTSTGAGSTADGSEDTEQRDPVAVAEIVEFMRIMASDPGRRKMADIAGDIAVKFCHTLDMVKGPGTAKKILARASPSGKHVFAY